MNADLILVDGYSVIHAWPELRAKHRRRLASARDELIRLLTRFSDESGKAVAIVFDGGKSSSPTAAISESVRGVEVLYSKRGQTADDIIERCVAMSKNPEAILVVTDDGAERRLCEGFGAPVASAAELRDLLASASADFSVQLASVRGKGRPPRRLQIRS